MIDFQRHDINYFITFRIIPQGQTRFREPIVRFAFKRHNVVGHVSFSFFCMAPRRLDMLSERLTNFTAAFLWKFQK